MHRNRTAASSARATPTTRCQKCLKLGHYSYQCTSPAQERPYISRPSRTQQLFNPTLRPRLTEAAPSDQPGQANKKGTADAILKQKEKEKERVRGRKRRRDSDAFALPTRSKSPLSSVSSYSSYSSVSSGRSPTPPGYSENRRASYISARTVRSPPRRRYSRPGSNNSGSPDHERTVRRKYRDSRSPPRRGRRLSLTDNVRRTRSLSPRRRLMESATPRCGLSNISLLENSPAGVGQGNVRVEERRQPLPRQYDSPPERSQSPFTKRRLMTEAMQREI